MPLPLATSLEDASKDSARAKKEKVGCMRSRDFLGMANAVLFAYDFLAK